MGLLLQVFWQQALKTFIQRFYKVVLGLQWTGKDEAKHVYLSRGREKTGFCICKNKDADQLRGNREADQHLCFRYTDSTIPLLPTSEISSL